MILCCHLLWSRATRGSARCFRAEMSRSSGRHRHSFCMQPGYQPERTAAALSQLAENDSAAQPMDECADDSQPVIGVPSMVGVPVPSKVQDARRAFHYQYSVASAWWQRWHQWCEPRTRTCDESSCCTITGGCQLSQASYKLSLIHI